MRYASPMRMSPPPQSAKDRALNFVREGILRGDLAGGELLSEGEIAGLLGLSRTPVREAFLILEAEGLMRLYPKRGALVVPVSPQEVRDVMETRRLVEGHVAAAVAEHPPAGLAGQLEAAQEAVERAARAGSGPGFADADRMWHRTIVAAAGNAVLLRIYDSLRDRQRRMGAATVAREPEAMDAFRAEHAAIGGAILAGDPARARGLMEAHIDGARRRLEG